MSCFMCSRPQDLVVSALTSRKTGRSLGADLRWRNWRAGELREGAPVKRRGQTVYSRTSQAVWTVLPHDPARTRGRLILGQAITPVPDLAHQRGSFFFLPHLSPNAGHFVPENAISTA